MRNTKYFINFIVLVFLLFTECVPTDMDQDTKKEDTLQTIFCEGKTSYFEKVIEPTNFLEKEFNHLNFNYFTFQKIKDIDYTIRYNCFYKNEKLNHFTVDYKKQIYFGFNIKFIEDYIFLYPYLALKSGEMNDILNGFLVYSKQNKTILYFNTSNTIYDVSCNNEKLVNIMLLNEEWKIIYQYKFSQKRLISKSYFKYSVYNTTEFIQSKSSNDGYIDKMTISDLLELKNNFEPNFSLEKKEYDFPPNIPIWLPFSTLNEHD